MKLGEVNAGHVLGTALAVLLPLSVFSPKAITPLFALCGLLVYFLDWRQGRKLPELPRQLVLILGGFLLWAALSLIWAVDSRDAAGKLGQLLGMIAAGLILFDAMRRLGQPGRNVLEKGLLTGIGLLLLLLAVETAFVAPLSKLAGNRGLAVETRASFTLYGMWFLKNASSLLAVFFWPAALVLYRRFGWMPTAAAIVAAVLEMYVIGSSSSLIAFLAGGGIFLLALWRPRLTVMLLGASLIVGTALMPFLPRLLPSADEMVKPSLERKNSAHHRLVIWNFAAERIMEKPFFGWGLDAARNIPGSEETVPFHIELDDGRSLVLANEQKLPLHPHNGFLQLWLELGAVGAGVGVVLVLLLLRGAGRAIPAGPPRAAALAAIASVLVVAGLSYGLWQSWWMASIWLSLATVAAVTGSGGREGEGAL